MPSIEGGERGGSGRVWTRRAFLGLGTIGAGAALLEWRVTDILTPPTPEERAQDIADVLNRDGVAYGVRVAVDYRLNFPSKREDDSVAVSNPLILEEGAYGYIEYDHETGLAEVRVAPSGELQELPDNVDLRHPDATPHVEEGGIAHVYYEVSHDAPPKRYHVTRLGTEAGLVAMEANIQSVGELAYSMR